MDGGVRRRSVQHRARLDRREGHRQPAAVHARAAARRHGGGAIADRTNRQVEGVYTSAAYTDDLNTVEITPNGQRGEMPGYTIWNLSANYPIEAWDCNLFLTVKNLTDELYVVDMSRGLIPGMPRLVQGGVRVAVLELGVNGCLNGCDSKMGVNGCSIGSCSEPTPSRSPRRS